MASETPHPWDEADPDQQVLVGQTGLADGLRRARVVLRDSLCLTDVWAHLRQLNAVSMVLEQDLKHNAPKYQAVENLLDYIEKGPTWRFHCLMRACALTGQDILVTKMGLDPNAYRIDGDVLPHPKLDANTYRIEGEVKQPPRQDDTTYRIEREVVQQRPDPNTYRMEGEVLPRLRLDTTYRLEGEVQQSPRPHTSTYRLGREVLQSPRLGQGGTQSRKRQWSEEDGSYREHPEDLDNSKSFIEDDLLKAIHHHCKHCQRHLMKRNLFDFNDHPAAETIETSQSFVNVDVEMMGDCGYTTIISAKDTLKPIRMAESPRVNPVSNINFQGNVKRQKSIQEEEDPPQTVRLYGPPGSGKTTYLRNLVYNWSTDFLIATKDSLHVPGDLCTTMVYVPATSVKTTVEKAIRDQLRCKKSDVDLLMAHVEKGEGVAVLIDAVDEIRSKAIMENVEKYVHERKNQGGPQVLVSARTDLCNINSLDFDRLLYLGGFTSKQGLEYVTSYFENLPDLQIRQQSTLDYLTKHIEDLEWLVHNPLRLHVFCALAAKGYLHLQEDDLISSLKLFDKLELFLITRECGRDGGPEVTGEESQAFYKMCLFAMLNSWREFPESLLAEFDISNKYLVFLERNDTINENAQTSTSYSFRHEFLYEYFASRCIQKLSLPLLKKLLIAICRQRSFRNVQKIMMQMILKQDHIPGELVKNMVQSILVFQSQTARPSVIPDHLLKTGNNTESPASLGELLQSKGDQTQAEDIDAIWEAIDKVFSVHDDKLRESGWFHGLEDDGTIGHVVDCLKTCTPKQQEDITPQTLLRLLPCVYVRFDDPVTIYPVGVTRWAKVSRGRHGDVYVWAWSLGDVLDVLQRSDQTDQKMTWLRLYIKHSRGLWGEPGDSAWSENTWRELLQHTTATSGDTLLGVLVEVLPSDPLGGLLACVGDPGIHLSPSGGYVGVDGGTVSLGDLDRCLGRVGRGRVGLELTFTRVLVPEGGQEVSLRPRREGVCGVLDCRGKRVLQEPRWETGRGGVPQTQEGGCVWGAGL